MRNTKLFGILFIAILTGVTVSCNKDDDATTPNETHPNGIKILNATAKTVINSTYTFGENTEQTVASMDIGEVEGDNFIILASSEQILISIDDNFTPNGETIVLQLSSGETYLGSNFTINEGNSSIELNGQVTSATSGSKNLSITLQTSQFGAGNSQYTVSSEKAFISGTLGTYTFNQILEINANNPNVTTIVLGIIEGSVNDEVNVDTGRLIREAGYTTHLNADSEIYSGGVDLFCSGKTRTREVGSKIGVHSWCCYEGQTADQLPQDSPAHNSQLAYFREMLGTTNGPDFYFFTLQAATFDSIHLMTDSEIEQYQLLTN